MNDSNPASDSNIHPQRTDPSYRWWLQKAAVGSKADSFLLPSKVGITPGLDSLDSLKRQLGLDHDSLDRGLWISRFGSPTLKAALALSSQLRNLYIAERLTQAFPGYCIDPLSQVQVFSEELGLESERNWAEQEQLRIKPQVVQHGAQSCAAWVAPGPSLPKVCAIVIRGFQLPDFEGVQVYKPYLTGETECPK